MKLTEFPFEQKPTGIRKHYRPKLLIGLMIGLLFELGGYFLLRGDQTAYGWSMFLAVPFVMGIAIALFSETPWQSFWGIFVALIIGTGFLILVKWEGYLCCILASPILLGCGAFGAVFGNLFRTWIIRKKFPLLAKFLLLGFGILFLAGAKAVEKPYLNARLEVFKTSVLVPATPDKSWSLLKSIEHVDTHKPLLLAVGLPIPQCCTLDREAVGGKRTCYFDQGMIAQEITEWNPPQSLKVKITESTLPGRHWLKFVDASYEFLPQGEKTLVTRTTTISSRLYPRWYWRTFEQYGVQSEHEYVLADLLRRAEIGPSDEH